MRYEKFLTKYSLWDHQKVAIDHVWHHLNKHNGVYLRASMGAGKTKIVIDIANNHNKIRNVLVICPAKALQVWDFELEKHSIVEIFDEALQTTVTILDGKTLQKKKNKLDGVDFTTGINFVVANYRSAHKIGLEHKRWDLIVSDESHNLKTADTIQTKFMAKLSYYGRYRIAMTGTPVGGKYEHLFGQMQFVNNKAYGNNYYSFLYRYCVHGGYKNHDIVGYQNLARLNSIYKDWSVDIEVDHDIPTRHIDIPLRLEDTASLNMYAKKVKDLKQAMIEGDRLKVMGCVTVMQQITSGYYNANRQAVHLNNNKIDALRELLEGINENVVVFYWFREDVKRIEKLVERMDYKLFQINGAMNDYKEMRNYTGDLPMLTAVQIQSGSASIDLTDSRYCIYYSNTHRFLDYTQSLARLNRPGQDADKGVIYYHLITQKTVDVSIRKSNNKKDDLMQALIRGDYSE